MCGGVEGGGVCHGVSLSCRWVPPFGVVVGVE